MIAYFNAKTDLHMAMRDNDSLRNVLDEYEAFVKQLNIPNFEIHAKFWKIAKFDMDDPPTEE